jgi:hypothetical protein
MRLLLALTFAAACSGGSKPATTATPSNTDKPAATADACTAHADQASCKADNSCYGAPYKGESVAACIYDARGFTTNCPWVACTATPPAK